MRTPRISAAPLRIEFEVDLPELPHVPSEAELIAALRAGLFMGGQFIQALWTRIAQAEKVHGSGAYVRGISDDGTITIRKTRGSETTNTYEADILVTNNAAHASIVEEGHAAFSLVQAINWASMAGRVKRSADGTPYLNIPFRHFAFADAGSRSASGMLPSSTKRMMPEVVYRDAVALVRTLRKNVGPIRGPEGADGSQGQFIAADRYRWGDRLGRGEVRTGFHGDTSGELFEERRSARFVGRSKSGALINPEWKSSRFEGMFRTGPKGHSSYMTIRTITPKSTGWNIPAQAGHYIARKTAMFAVRDERLTEVIFGGIRAAFGG